jgi:sugar O-acyltransferase (sialic acid O-acetyltransferase NeuD family)
MKNEIVLIGGGGHCRSCIDVIEAEGIFSIQGIVDKSELVGKKILEYPILCTDDDLPLSGIETYFITVGQIESPVVRMNIFKRLESFHHSRPVIVSPYAYVSRHATLGAGTIVMHGAVINAGVVIGENSIINSKALIEHDVQVGSFCHISTASVLNGGVVVGEGSFIGSNTTINQIVSIPARTVIGSGSVVTAGNRLQSGNTYWGNPLKARHHEK